MSLSTIITGNEEFLEAQVVEGYTLAPDDIVTLHVHDRQDLPPFLAKEGIVNGETQTATFVIAESDMDWYPTRHVYYEIRVTPADDGGPFTLTTGHLRTLHIQRS